MLLITLGLSFNYFTTAYKLGVSKIGKCSHCTYCNVNTKPSRDKDNMERCQSNVHDTQEDNPETYKQTNMATRNHTGVIKAGQRRKQYLIYLERRGFDRGFIVMFHITRRLANNS